MADSEFFILESCKNPGQRIIAQLNRRRTTEAVQNEKQLGETKISLEGDVKEGIEPITLIVYYSSNDVIAGCFTLVNQTQTEGYDYYINPSPNTLFKNCIDCQYQLGVENISRADIIQKAEESKTILTQIIDKI